VKTNTGLGRKRRESMSNSNITSCDSWSFSTENTGEDAGAVKQKLEMLGQLHSPNSNTSTTTNNSNGSNTTSQPPHKKKRNLPGNPGHLITSLTLFFFISTNTNILEFKFMDYQIKLLVIEFPCTKSCCVCIYSSSSSAFLINSIARVYFICYYPGLV